MENVEKVCFVLLDLTFDLARNIEITSSISRGLILY